MSISELRTDPISGRKVLIAEDRAGRPNDFESTAAVPTSDPSFCPFCVGHERDTPEALLELLDKHGNWQVRVIPNKYPAVLKVGTERSETTGTQLLSTQPAYGAHEVIVESPRHIQDLTELSIAELSTVLLVYRDRLRHWSRDPSMRHATLFKNVGHKAGASLQHLHSQLVALPFVPEAISNELQAAKNFHDQEGACIFCKLLQEEINLRERLVGEEGDFIAFCAYAGRQAFETWILPTRHASHYEQLADDQARPLARLLQQVVRRLQTQLKPLSYNLVLHSAPFGEQASDSYHWHFELIPRTAQLAGLEWGAGVYINSLSPERAAKLLREAGS